MTIKEFNSLFQELKEVIINKAIECNVDLVTYLEHTDDNFVISSKKGNIVEWGDTDYNYVVYGDKNEAIEDLTDDYGDIVITETMGILILNSKIMLKNLEK